MRERDVLTVESIGAYSYVSASEFNGFPRPDVIKTD
jgi:diaminopimelate decarboxylase